MKVGFLHLGTPQDGLHRYSRIISNTLQRESELDIIDVTCNLTGLSDADHTAIVSAAKALSIADVVHLQHNERIWGGGTHHTQNLLAFSNNCSSKLVATLHDLPPYPRLMRRPFSAYNSQEKQGMWRRPSFASRPKLSTYERLMRLLNNNLLLPRVLGRIDRLLVMSEDERERLTRNYRVRNVQVVPHFVEKRRLSLTNPEAKEQLGFNKKTKVLTILGYIVPRKGYHLAIEAMCHFDDTIRLVFAGGAIHNSEEYVNTLMERAYVLGIESQVLVTGYLSESMLNVYLSATDLALCPFLSVSASGSLSTWISSGTPILASALPLIHEYNDRVQDAIQTFETGCVESLTDAVRQIFSHNSMLDTTAGIEALGSLLSVEHIAAEHMTVYRDVADPIPRKRWIDMFSIQR